VLFIFILFLCSSIFAASANASVTIEGDSTPYSVSIGDTLSVTSRTSLQPGENFVRWEIVSGTGNFVDDTEDSTGFIPSSSDVVIRRVTRNLPIYEISDKMTKFNYDKNSVAISKSLYGVRVYFDTDAGGEFLLVYKNNQAIGLIDFYGDSTFSNSVPSAPTDSFVVIRDCADRRCVIRTQPNTKVYLFFMLQDIQTQT
jgi:hypothetical protein